MIQMKLPQGSARETAADEENYKDLANAIIVQAAKDYRAAYKRMVRFPDDKAAQREIRQIRKFFNSSYFSMLTDLDGPSLLRRITDEMKGE